MKKRFTALQAWQLFPCPAALLIWGVLGCSAPPAATNVFMFGAIIDRTGSDAEPSWGESVTLAENDMNAALAAAGHADYSFQVMIDDSRNDPPTAVARALDLVKNQGARALVLDSSSNTTAVNSLNYDADPTNDLMVPMQCNGCTSSSINNPAAVNADPVQQLALRNGQKWLFRSIMSSKLVAMVINRDLLKLGTPAADVNGDGQVKIAIYNSDELFGNSAANDIISFAQQLQTNPPVLIEQHKHPATADVNSYNWAADLDLLTNNFNETTNKVDAVPDFIVGATFAQYYIPLIKTWKISGYDQRVSRMVSFYTLRIESALEALGAFGEGQEGISQVLLDDGPSGQVFAQEVQAAFGHPPLYRDSQYYDATITLMLATWRAAHGLPMPAAVTPTQIRDAMLGIEDVSAAIVRTGPAELAHALTLLDSGMTLNYEGASGPMDFDATQSIKDRLSHFRVTNQQYVDLETYDCIRASNTSTPAALAAACPVSTAD